MKLDASNEFLTETGCFDISAKELLLKFTTTLNKSRHVDVCIHRRLAQSADPSSDSLSLFLSSDLHQHRPDVLCCTSSTSGTERRHCSLPVGAEDVVHERRSGQPQRLDLLQQTGCRGRGDQRGLNAAFLEHISILYPVGRIEICLGSCYSPSQLFWLWWRSDVERHWTVKEPKSPSSDFDGNIAQRLGPRASIIWEVWDWLEIYLFLRYIFFLKFFLWY